MYGLDIVDCVMVVTDTMANMNTVGKKLEEKLNVDHGLCIDHIFQLTVALAFKSTNHHKRKAGSVSEETNPTTSDKIDA
jgi:hypothetical protein